MKSGEININLNQLRILGLDYVLRRFEGGGDRGVPKDNVSSTELAIFVEEDLESQYSIEILMVHQIEIGSCKLFVCNKEKIM